MQFLSGGLARKKKAVERRAAQLPAEYRTPLANLDTKYHGTQPGQVVRRSEKHFFQHLNKASPDYGAQVCLVGTLNLCLKEPKKMEKTRDESDHSGLRKFQKNAKKLQN